MLLATRPVLKKHPILSETVSNQVAGSAAQPIKEARGTLEDDFESVATGVARQDAVRCRGHKCLSPQIPQNTTASSKKRLAIA